MIKLLQKLLKKEKTGSDELILAEEDFDKLMKEVEGDETSLSHLERHMREEWQGIHEDLENVEKEVDEIVED